MFPLARLPFSFFFSPFLMDVKVNEEAETGLAVMI